MPEEETEVCYETDYETLVLFLSQVTADTGRIVRWEQAPVLRVAQGSVEERRFVRESVKRLNGLLPAENQIDFREDADPSPLSSTVPDGEIYLDFAPIDSWTGGCSVADEVNALGCAETPRGDLVSAHVWVEKLNTIGKARQCENGHLGLIIHELLHALGFNAHPDQDWGIHTIMNRVRAYCDTPGNRRLHEFAEHGNENPQEFELAEVPGVLDRDALRAMYSLGNGDYPEELRIEPEEECDSQ